MGSMLSEAKKKEGGSKMIGPISLRICRHAFPNDCLNDSKDPFYLAIRLAVANCNPLVDYGELLAKLIKAACKFCTIVSPHKSGLAPTTDNVIKELSRSPTVQRGNWLNFYPLRKRVNGCK